MAKLTSKIHVVDVLGTDEINTAKAWDGVSNAYQFLNGKWVLWDQYMPPSQWHWFTIGCENQRARHRQAVGMFIRVGV